MSKVLALVDGYDLVPVPWDALADEPCVVEVVEVDAGSPSPCLPRSRIRTSLMLSPIKLELDGRNETCLGGRVDKG